MSQDPMLQDDQGMMNYDQSNPTMVPNVNNPIISEEQVFDDYREDHQMMEMDSRPGKQQDYYDSEYQPKRSPSHTSSSQPDPYSKPTHVATASVGDTNHDNINKDDSEKSMTPRAMAAFQQHIEFEDPGLDNNQKYRSDLALARQESTSSIPCSSDMISVKNIEDREDEYSKMKLALLSDIASNNGSSSPLAAITSPSLAPPGIISPSRRNEREPSSSVYRDKTELLGNRTIRSKDNLESIFGGTIAQNDNKFDTNRSNSSAVHKPLLQNKTNDTLARNVSNTTDNAYRSRTDGGNNPNPNINKSKNDPRVITANSSAFHSTSNHSTHNSQSDKSLHIIQAAENHVKNNNLTSSQSKAFEQSNIKKSRNSASHSQQAYHQHTTESMNSYEYSAIPSAKTSKAGIKSNEDPKRPKRQIKPTGFIKEEPFPQDISPESNYASFNLRSSNTNTQLESERNSLAGEKKGVMAQGVSTSATGDVYTIPELPEEEEECICSSPLGADGLLKRRTTGRSR